MNKCLEGYLHYYNITLERTSKVLAIKDHLQHQQEVLEIYKDNPGTSQNRMTQQADQQRSEISFEEGNWVFLRLQPYKNMSLKQLNMDNKLEPKYYGPYKVL